MLHIIVNLVVHEFGGNLMAHCIVDVLQTWTLPLVDMHQVVFLMIDNVDIELVVLIRP
jgi:hypothetical protein